MNRSRFHQILLNHKQQVHTSTSVCLWKFLIQRIGGLGGLYLTKKLKARTLMPVQKPQQQRLSELIKIVREGTYRLTLVLERTLQGKQQPLALSAIPLAELPYGKTCDVKTPDSIRRRGRRYYAILDQTPARYDALKSTLMQPLTARLAKVRKKREHLLAQKQESDQAEI